MGSGYQLAFNKAIADLQAKDPATVCTNDAVEYSAISSQYCVLFFERPFIVDVKKGEIFDQPTRRSLY